MGSGCENANATATINQNAMRIKWRQNQRPSHKTSDQLLAIVHFRSQSLFNQLSTMNSMTLSIHHSILPMLFRFLLLSCTHFYTLT